ncbi:hypothetical protein CEXT_388271 [Caerostris extrusa]|uniref:Uncharacterized protein n=1 Tax=Caerostris extrusa TaxID=172846 RepID=A0AAV4VL62_CAEEX|nr:hypothetical protein CEXT_388271 [Caerostris extrusa]
MRSWTAIVKTSHFENDILCPYKGCHCQSEMSHRYAYACFSRSHGDMGRKIASGLTPYTLTPVWNPALFGTRISDYLLLHVQDSGI